MRYKILLTGKNDAAIDDFFEQMEDDFEVLTTSARYDDILGHIDYFVPDLFIFCLYNESRDHIVQMVNIKHRLSRENVPFVIIGSKENCDEFQRIAVNVPDLVLHRPLSVEAVQKKILDFLKERGICGTAGMHVQIAGQPEDQETDGQDFPEQAGQTQRKHILVVDDNVMMLKLIKEHLRDKYDVATAVSGKVALKFLERRKTDLILLDYAMPEESGVDVLEKLRASDTAKEIPVIFLTGVTERKKIKEALIRKPQGYLLKPVDREKLLETIEKVIG